MDICRKAAESATIFEKTNTELKRQYLIHNIMLYNFLVLQINQNHGSFGTGYPFYILDENLNGKLPIIEEQIRYDNELLEYVESSRCTTWSCSQCLEQFHHTMPDLKQICKPCPNMDNNLKPRKIINRMPDIDMWMISERRHLEATKLALQKLLEEHNMHTSDIDPVQSIIDMDEISYDLSHGEMPHKMLPIDTHIIDKETLESLIEQVPDYIKNALNSKTIPYLPIHPTSLRKTWQNDDSAYNFIHDYLSSLTSYNWDSDLQTLLEETRRYIANKYSYEELYNILISTGPESVLRRHRTKELPNRFRERINSWKK